MPSLSRITVYPIKSFDGRDLASSNVVSNGALVNDRRYALIDQNGKYVNGKNCAAIHRIRSTFGDDLQHVTLSCDGQARSFAIAKQQEQLAVWCSEALGISCKLVENDKGGFPDDQDSPGLTLVSTATLEAIADWFPALELDEVRRRFRFNLEVADVPPFWEDRLVADNTTVQQFRVGQLTWQGCGICQRCVVPARDSQDGTVTERFAKEFSSRREAALPNWAPQNRFDHYYRLGVNTRLAAANGDHVVRVGDPVELVS